MHLFFQTESVPAPKHYFCGSNDWRFVKRQKVFAFICRVYIHGDYGLVLRSEAEKGQTVKRVRCAIAELRVSFGQMHVFERFAE